MLAKGKIVYIYEHDVSNIVPEKRNKVRVHISSFDSPGIRLNTDIDATISLPPTTTSPYKVGDVVFVGFENNSISKPVVLGKLYLGNDKDDNFSFANLSELSVQDKVNLPENTTIGGVVFDRTKGFAPTPYKPGNNVTIEPDGTINVKDPLPTLKLVSLKTLKDKNDANSPILKTLMAKVEGNFNPKTMRIALLNYTKQGRRGDWQKRSAYRHPKDPYLTPLITDKGFEGTEAKGQLLSGLSTEWLLDKSIGFNYFPIYTEEDFSQDYSAFKLDKYNFRMALCVMTIDELGRPIYGPKSLFIVRMNNYYPGEDEEPRKIFDSFVIIHS